MSDLVERLRSFTDWHQDLWHEKGIGTPHAAMRDALYRIEELEADAKRNRDLYTLAGVGAKRKRINQLSGYLVKEEERVVELQAQVEELTYLVTELDAHEGAEGWSTYLELELKKWRNYDE